MSSPSPSPGPAKPKRPGVERHTSSFFAKLHRKHDVKPHPERQPLLVDELPDSDTEAQEEAPPSPPPQRSSCFRTIINASRDLIKKFANASARIFKKAYVVGRRNIKAILLAIFLALITGLIALSVGLPMHHARLSQVTLCTSPACVHAASELLHSLSPDYMNIDPCENFDVLTCQGFEEKHDLRPDQGDMFRGTIMAEDAEVTLRHILETDISDIDAADQHNFKKLQADYNACMNEETIKEYGLKPIRSVIDRIKMVHAGAGSGYPSEDSSVLQTTASPTKVTRGELTNVFVYMAKLGLDPLVSLGVGADDKEPDTQIVFASPPRSIGLPSKEYYKNNDTVESYQSMMSSVLPHFLETADNSTPLAADSGLRVLSADLAAGIVALEIKLADAMPSEEDLNDVTKTYNKIKTSDTEDLLPQLSIADVIKELGPKDYKAESVIVASPPYMRHLSKIIGDTRNEVLQGYLVWKVIQSYASRVEDPVLQPLTRFNNKLQGKEPDAKPERWRRCISAADGDLGWMLSKFFVDKAFSPESKAFGDLIVSDIKDSFVAFLKAASWMTSDNQDHAIKKVHAIDQKIGYPTTNPDILNPKALQNYYKTVLINNNTFFDNAIQVARFETRQEWSKLGKPTRHDEWGMSVPTVNAYYNPAGNEIVFPAGIMQSPVFYEPSVPQYLSYGAFGAVSGHELSHAFDNTGSQYDEAGRYVDWWSNDTRKAFEEKTSCFVNQYEEYTITSPDGKELHVNGHLTLGENVADAGGIHAAFRAWKKREIEEPGQLLPGLDYFTKDQLFFINYAGWWCGKSTKETAVRRIYTDPHAPKFARILGTMANSADFREAFNCPSKKPTCDLW